MLPRKAGKLASVSETEGADCVAIGDWGIFEKLFAEWLDENWELKIKKGLDIQAFFQQSFDLLSQQLCRYSV